MNGKKEKEIKETSHQPSRLMLQHHVEDKVNTRGRNRHTNQDD